MKTIEVSKHRLDRLLEAVDELSLDQHDVFCRHYCPAGKTIKPNELDPCTDGIGCRRFMLKWLTGGEHGC